MTIGENIGKKVLIEMEVTKNEDTGRVFISNPLSALPWDALLVNPDTPCYPLPGEGKCPACGVAMNPGCTECDECGYKEPSEPAFKFGDEVQVNGIDYPVQVLSQEGNIVYYTRKPLPGNSVVGGTILAVTHCFVRPIPAKPTLEQKIEEALDKYEREMLRTELGKSGSSGGVIKEAFMSRIKAAIEEEGK